MQLLIDQSKLARALQVAGRIVPKRPVSPVLSGIVISATHGEVRLRSTDLQSYADISLPAEVHVFGEVAVYGRLLSGVVSTLPEGDVALSVSDSGESLRITAGPAAFRLRTLDPSDFPTPGAPATWDAQLAKENLIDLVARTTFCATDSEDVSPFAGVMVAAAEGGLVMAATDSYQLAYYRLPVEMNDEFPSSSTSRTFKAVLPTGGLAAFTRALQSFGGDDVRLAWQDRAVVFASDGLSWLIRRLDVQYPDLSRFTGPMAGVRVQVDKAHLLEAVRQVSSIAEDGYRTLCLSLDGTRLHLFTSEQELGEAQTVVQLKGNHPRRQVWLDARRLANALRAQPCDEVALYISEPLAPVALVPAADDVSFRTVLMPLRHYVPDSEAM